MPEQDPNPNADVLKGIEQNGEHAILEQRNTTEAVKNLELPTEGILAKTAEIAENTKPKDVQKMQIISPDDAEDKDWNENEAGKSLWKMLRGPKGHTPVKGTEYYTPEEKQELMDEMVPKITSAATPVKGKDYMTDEEMQNLADEIFGRVRVPEDGHTPEKGVDYNDGEDGDDGDMPSDEKLLELIQSIMPKPTPGPKGDQGNDGRKITGKEIVAKIKGLLSYDDLKDLPNLDTFRRPSGVASKTYSTSELDDVSMQGILAGQVLQWDGHKFIPYTPTSGGGVTQVFGEVLTISGGNTFTLAHTPVAGTVRLYRNGTYQQNLAVSGDYTMSAATGTLINPVVGTEVFLVDYNY